MDPFKTALYKLYRERPECFVPHDMNTPLSAVTYGTLILPDADGALEAVEEMVETMEKVCETFKNMKAMEPDADLQELFKDRLTLSEESREKWKSQLKELSDLCVKASALVEKA